MYKSALLDCHSRPKLVKLKSMICLRDVLGNARVEFVTQKVCSVARGHTDTKVNKDRPNTENSLSGFQDFFL